MKEKQEKEKLVAAIVVLNDTRCLELIHELLEEGVEALDIMVICQKALDIVEEKYVKGEYYIAGLIMVGEIMRQILDVLAPLLMISEQNKYIQGNVLIGTVWGDIHDLGKNMAGSLLYAYGFNVKDLGVDVSPESFLEETLAFKPDVVGISSLLSSNHANIKNTITLLKENLPNDINPVYFLSGPGMRNSMKEKLGVDYIVTDVIETVKLCEKITIDLSKKKKETF